MKNDPNSTNPSDIDAHGTDPSPGQRADHEDPKRAALLAALIELEHHVAEGGWDQPPRLFALAFTDELISAEPELASHLGLRGTEHGGQPGALTGIEQDPLDPAADLVETLRSIEWPETVHGCVVALERTFLPSSAQADIPEDADAAAQYVNEHADREDIRVLVGAVRGGDEAGGTLTHGVARLVSQPEELLGGETLVPGLAEVVARTLMTDLPNG